MAEPYDKDETTAPENPPNAVLNPRVRRAAVWTYLGPLVAFFVVVGIALFYVATRPPDRVTNEERAWNVTGTTGETAPGGHSPDIVPATPEKEIEERGVIRDINETPAPGVKPQSMLTHLGDVTRAKADEVIGRRVDLQNVAVIDVTSATSFAVQDGNAKVAVVTPEQSPAPRNGQRINLAGTIERDASGGIRIRASQMDLRH